MTYHIRICKVNNDHIVFIGTDSIHQLLTYFRSTHLRLKVVGCNRRGLNKDSVFVLIWFFYTTIKEESNMCILLCLCKTNLCLAICCKILTKCIVDLFFLKCNDLVWYRLIIIFEAYIYQWKSSVWSVESVKIVTAECSGDLSCSVWSEVKENNGIIWLYK